MSNDEIDCAIAEWRGWTNIETTKSGIRLFGTRPDANGDKYQIQAVPQYHKCLNAMTEARKGLTDIQWITYLQILSGETDVENSAWPTCFLNLDAVREMVEANAITQAIALLRTIGKYQ